MASGNSRSVRRRGLVVRTIYAACLVGLTYSHWAAIFQHGFLWDHGGFSRASATFWSILAVIDPAAAVLLFKRPNVGVMATAAIIIADVIHNVWIQARYFPPLLHGLGEAPQVAEQIAFMTFVVITAPWAWTRAHLPASLEPNRLNNHTQPSA